jgi:hypothetical protein
MIYSQWRPSGGYDYFETSEAVALGNDLPVPQLHALSGIGAPSVEVGRTIPTGARHVGTGAVPLGVISPIDRSRIGAMWSADSSVSPMFWFVAGAAGVAVLWQATRKGWI